MITATISQLENDLGGYLRQVKAGRSILVMERSTPVARLTPIAGESGDEDARLARLERAGVIVRGSGESPLSVLDAPAAHYRKVLDALIEERGEGEEYR